MEIQENNLLKLLIVDDQQREIDGIAHMLKWDTLGIEVAYCATEANKAIEILVNEQVDTRFTQLVHVIKDGNMINVLPETIARYAKILARKGYLPEPIKS